MKYTVHINDLEKALGLDSFQANKIKSLLAVIYHQLPDSDFSIDEVNARIAPHLHTPEEAFFAGQTIICDVIGAAGYLKQ